MMAFAIYVTAHVVGAVAGFWLIARMARSAMTDRMFWLATGLLSVLIWLYLFEITSPPNYFMDFKKAYFAGGQAVLSGPEALRPLLEKNVEGFVNLPIVAYVFVPIALLRYDLAGPVYLLVGAIAAVLAWAMLRRRYGMDRAESGLTLFAFAGFGPLAYSMREGNTSHFLLMVLVFGLTLVGARRDLAAGAVFAVAAVIKPPLTLIGIYFLLRRRFRIVAGAIVFGGFVVTLSLLVFGWDLHLFWFHEFIVYSERPMAAFNAQSIASTLLRLEHGPASLQDWKPYSLSPFHYILNIGLILLVGLLGWWACRRPLGKSSPLYEDIEPMMVLAIICIVSTISWSHYYVWLIPALTALFIVSWRDPAAPRFRFIVWAAFAMAAPAIFFIKPLEQGVMGHKVSSLMASYLLIAGVLIYALLIKLRMASSVPIQARVP